jgi:putative aminopeptidase FrvX
METAALLRELTEARGPSGYEGEVRKLIHARFAEHAHDVRVDPLGNCIARMPGTGDPPPGAARSGAAPSDGARPALMLTAHMDEVALMVTQVEKGFLRVTQVGGFDPRVLLGQEVIVHGTRELPGLVVSVPPHFTDPADREKPVPLEKLFIDVGLPPEDAVSVVHVGDLVTLRARWTELAGGCVTCKSMDDRAAMASIILCLEELSRRTHAWDVLAVATVQEEIGCRGAVTGAFGVAPAAAIALDATFAIQPGLSPVDAVKMDGGPSIAIGPNFHARLSDRLIEAAKAIELPYQVEPIPAESGTDAWRIQVSREGVPCALVGIPVKFMHTPVETVCLRDVERAGRLLAEVICRLPIDFAGSLETRDALAPARS